jgi:hypothetical protein
MEDGTQSSVIQFRTACHGPWFDLLAGGTKDRLSGAVKGFFDVVPIQMPIPVKRIAFPLRCE